MLRRGHWKAKKNPDRSESQKQPGPSLMDLKEDDDKRRIRGVTGEVTTPHGRQGMIT
jgi:hypothetical protein